MAWNDMTTGAGWSGALLLGLALLALWGLVALLVSVLFRGAVRRHHHPKRLARHTADLTADTGWMRHG